MQHAPFGYFRVLSLAVLTTSNRVMSEVEPISPPAPDLHHPGLYINRELSQLGFNQRVLND